MDSRPNGLGMIRTDLKTDSGATVPLFEKGKKMVTLGSIVLALLFNFSTAFAAPTDGCPNGTYSVTHSPDGGTLSILFDHFSLEVGGNTALARATKTCSLNIPLSLPAGYSVGVYKVDYRGFALLAKKQTSELKVRYALGPHANGRNYQRTVRGLYSGDFLFSETLGAGAMRRVGCGESAKLSLTITLDLLANGQSDLALASLDSTDGTPRRGLIYHLDYKPCH